MTWPISRMSSSNFSCFCSSVSSVDSGTRVSIALRMPEIGLSDFLSAAKVERIA